MTSQASRDAFRRIRDIEEAAVDFNYTPHVRKICYKDAIAIALQHQICNPEWFVCGSLALMLSGITKAGDVSDVDFVTNTFPKRVQFYTTKYHKHIELSEGNQWCSYYHCEYSEFVDLFIHSQPVSIETYKYRGLHIQNIQDVIKWKRHFNRDKDKTDLSQIYLPESLFEI